MVPLPLMPYGPLVGTTVFQEVLLVRKLSLNIISKLPFHWVIGTTAVGRFALGPRNFGGLKRSEVDTATHIRANIF
jgi:hypothetical protein